MDHEAPASLVPDDAVLVLFGATGDLAKRKLLPALFHLQLAGLMPRHYQIIGSAPPAGAPDSEGFKDLAHSALEEFGRKGVTDEAWSRLGDSVSFVPGTDKDLSALTAAVEQAEKQLGSTRRIIYLAVPPPAFIPMIEGLEDSGLVSRDTRLIIEKPFGSDLDSARRLNAALHQVFDESQIFRIDHFLGKEAVQNILALRFANGLFEPAWNAEHLDYVQVDVPEQLTVEGRGAFYDATGAFRDMIVTHLCQLVGFIAMEKPTAFDAASLHATKLGVFRAMEPLDPSRTVFGQYDGYRTEPGVATDSVVETFVAVEVRIDNARWRDVPFYLRTGKAMAATSSTVTLGFKQGAAELFAMANETIQPDTNELTIDLADPGTVSVAFLAKQPGPHMAIEPVAMSFRYADSFNVANELEAYERLLHDVMIGDPTLFNSDAGIERLWQVAAPLLAAPPPPVAYEQRSWGPQQAADLLQPRAWRQPHMADQRT